MGIILKYIEITNHCGVYQALTQCCRLIILQKQINQQNKLIKKEVRFVVIEIVKGGIQ